MRPPARSPARPPAIRIAHNARVSAARPPSFSSANPLFASLPGLPYPPVCCTNDSIVRVIDLLCRVMYKGAWRANSKRAANDTLYAPLLLPQPQLPLLQLLLLLLMQLMLK